MRAILEGSTQAWPLDWGMNLVGTGKDADIQLPGRSGAAAVAAVLVRWMDFVVCLGVGEPPGLIIGDRRIMYRKLSFQPLRPRESHALRIGNEHFTLRWEAVAPPAEGTEFGKQQLEEVLQGAVTLAGRTVKPAGIPPGEVGPLLARMTGARVLPMGSALKPGATVQFKISQSGPKRDVSLVWDGPAMDRARVESLSLDLAAGLEENARANAPGAAHQPCYRDVTVRLPHLSVPVGPYGILDPDDFSHLRLAPGRARDPQLLVTTIAGRIEVLDLSAEPTLTHNGTRVRRCRVNAGDRLTIFDVALQVDLSANAETVIPDRIFRALALPTDPVAGLARLGLVLPQLSGATDRQLAYLLCAQSTLRAAGAGLGVQTNTGDRVYGPALLRFPQGGIERGAFDRCVMLERAVHLAAMNGGKFVSADASTDPNLVTDAVPLGAAVPPDRRVPVWGPVAVLGGDDLAPILAVWRAPGEIHFTATELHVLDVLRRAIAGDRAAAITTLTEKQPPQRLPASASSFWLHWNSLHVPVGAVTLVGRSPSCDLSLLYDKSVSGRHALLVRDGDSVRLMDFRSTNGVRVNDQKVEEAVLAPGDMVAIGGMRMVFRRDEQGLEGGIADRYLPPGAEAAPDPALVAEVNTLLDLGRATGAASELRARLPAAVTGLASLLKLRVCVVAVPPNREDLEVVLAAPVPPGGELLAKLTPLVLEALGGRAPVWSGQPDAMALPLPECSEARGARWAVLVLREGAATPPARVEAAAAALDPLLARGPGDWARGHDLELPLLTTGARVVPVAGPLWIGRGPECALRLDGEEVSRRHALVVATEGTPPGLKVLDFKSSRGLLFNGAAVNEALLADGDTVRVASLEIRAQIPRGAVPPGRRAQAGLLRWTAGIATLGHALHAAPAEQRLETLARLVRERLDALRVQLVDLASGQVKVAVQDPSAPLHAERAGEPLRHAAIERARTSGRAVVQTLTEAEVYKRHVGTIPMLAPLAERCWLVVPMPTASPRLACVVTSLRQPVAAFDHGALAVVAALTERALSLQET